MALAAGGGAGTAADLLAVAGGRAATAAAAGDRGVPVAGMGGILSAAGATDAAAGARDDAPGGGNVSTVIAPATTATTAVAGDDAARDSDAAAAEATAEGEPTSTTLSSGTAARRSCHGSLTPGMPKPASSNCMARTSACSTSERKIASPRVRRSWRVCLRRRLATLHRRVRFASPAGGSGLLASSSLMRNGILRCFPPPWGGGFSTSRPRPVIDHGYHACSARCENDDEASRPSWTRNMQVVRTGPGRADVRRATVRGCRWRRVAGSPSPSSRRRAFRRKAEPCARRGPRPARRRCSLPAPARGRL